MHKVELFDAFLYFSQLRRTWIILAQIFLTKLFLSFFQPNFLFSNLNCFSARIYISFYCSFIKFIVEGNFAIFFKGVAVFFSRTRHNQIITQIFIFVKYFLCGVPQFVLRTIQDGSSKLLRGLVFISCKLLWRLVVFTTHVYFKTWILFLGQNVKWIWICLIIYFYFTLARSILVNAHLVLQRNLLIKIFQLIMMHLKSRN